MAKGEYQRPDGEGVEGLREIPEDELREILAAHATWLKTDGKEGQRADLREANIRDANLQGVNLSYANLEGTNLPFASFAGAILIDTNLQGANLRGADLEGAYLQDASLREAIIERAVLELTNLRGANLQNANLKGANLLYTDLRDANLRDAKFSFGSEDPEDDTTGFSSIQFAGAGLTSVTLPPDIAAFAGLDHVAEISRHARNIFLAVIGSCVFSWLTMATTTDVALLTNSGSSPLPIIQTKVPMAGFFWAAPVILLALYCYLHLYL